MTTERISLPERVFLRTPCASRSGNSYQLQRLRCRTTVPAPAKPAAVRRRGAFCRIKKKYCAVWFTLKFSARPKHCGIFAASSLSAAAATNNIVRFSAERGVLPRSFYWKGNYLSLILLLFRSLLAMQMLSFVNNFLINSRKTSLSPEYIEVKC